MKSARHARFRPAARSPRRRRRRRRSAERAARKRRHVDAAARPPEERDAGARRQQPARRRRDDGREGRQGRGVRRRRQARPGERRAAAEGLDLPHLLDVEADHRRRDDDAVRGRQVAAQRPGVEAHSRVREPQGRESESADRRGHAGRAGSCDDDARADVALRRPHLRRVRQHRSRQDVHGRERARPRRAAAGDDRQARQDSAAAPAGRALALQRLGRRAGLPGREAVGPAVSRIPASSASSSRSA